MIAQVVLLQCNACAACMRVRQRTYARRFFGTTIRVPVELASCEDCNTVVECEAIPESVGALHAYKAEILRESAALGHSGWPVDQGWPDEGVIDEQIRFLPHRLGPARCLTCHGTAITRAEPGASGNPSVRHLGCGGLYDIVGLEYVEEEDDVVEIDIEGERTAARRPRT